MENIFTGEAKRTATLEDPGRAFNAALIRPLWQLQSLTVVQLSYHSTIMQACDLTIDNMAWFLLTPLSLLTVSPARICAPSNLPSVEDRQALFSSSITEDFAITTTYDDFADELAHGQLVTDPHGGVIA